MFAKLFRWTLLMTLACGGSVALADSPVASVNTNQGGYGATNLAVQTPIAAQVAASDGSEAVLASARYEPDRAPSPVRAAPGSITVNVGQAMVQIPRY